MDVLETISAIHFFYQITCLSPCQIDRKIWSLKASKVLEIYSLIIIAASLAIMLFDIFKEDDFIKANDNDLGQTVDFIQMLGIRVAHIASMTEALLRRNELKKMYQKIKEIDRIFERCLNVNVNNKKFHSNTLLVALLMSLVYFTAQIFILISKLVCNEGNFIFYWMCYLMPSLVCGMRYFQMFTSMRILRYRFDLLVKVLGEINLKTTTCEMPPDTKDPVKYVESVIEHKYSLALLEYSMPPNRCCDMESRNLKKLLIIRDVYNRLFHLSEIFNYYFGLSMLVNVGNDFISITSNCYWIFYNFHDLYITRCDMLRIAVSFAWSLPHLLNVIMLALLCEGTLQKAKKIALHLHGINIDIWNDNHNSVIEQFSLQLLHQKISITAAGFFSIDCTLLYTIVGATTTYLIILIQFHMNETKFANAHKH